MSCKSNVKTKLVLGVSIFAVSGAVLWTTGAERAHAGSLKVGNSIARARIAAGVSRVHTRLSVPKRTLPAKNFLNTGRLKLNTARPAKRIKPTGAPVTGNVRLSIGGDRRLPKLSNPTIPAARKTSTSPKSFWRIEDANTAARSVKTWTMKSVLPKKVKPQNHGSIKPGLNTEVGRTIAERPVGNTSSRRAAPNSGMLGFSNVLLGDGSGQAEYLDIALTNVKVTSYQFSGSGYDTPAIGRHAVAARLNTASPDVSSAGIVPVDQISMNYERVGHVYSEQDKVSPRFNPHKVSGNVKIEGKSVARHVDTSAVQHPELFDIALGGPDTLGASKNEKDGRQTPFFSSYRPQFFDRALPLGGNSEDVVGQADGVHLSKFYLRPHYQLEGEANRGDIAKDRATGVGRAIGVKPKLLILDEPKAKPDRQIERELDLLSWSWGASRSDKT
jgi:hypothetical protein